MINISAAGSEPDQRKQHFSYSSSEDSKIIEEAKLALMEFEKFQKGNFPKGALPDLPEMPEQLKTKPMQ